MSLQADWDSAATVGVKPRGDLGSQWDDAEPVKIPKATSRSKPKEEALPPPLAAARDWNTGMAEAGANMASGMVAKPVSDVAGLSAVVRDLFSKQPGGDPQGFQRDVQRRMTYEPRTEMGRNISQYNPLALIAKLFGWAGNKAEGAIAPPESSGPARAAAGSGVNEAIQQLPALLGAKASPVADAAAGGVKDLARGTMQSALKPDLRKQQQTMPGTGKSKSDAAIDTLLDEGINVTKGGADKLKGRIDVLNDKIKTLIDNSPATIDKQHVGYYAQSAIDKFKNQVDKAKDVKAIQDVWDRFLNDFDIPDKIPVKRAQELKQGTNRAIGDKAYGELTGPEKEAQKALVRGLKEEIARAVPEVRTLNAQESQLLNALSLVEKRALVEANKNPMGLSLLAMKPEAWAAFMADRSGLFKSIVARMLNTGSEALPPLGATMPAIGAAASQDRQQQLPPPPR